MRLTKLILAIALLLALTGAYRPAGAAGSRYAAAFLVTNTSDSGAGSLRAAIDDANASPGADVIEITTAGTLLLLSALPAVTDPVTIQGPGAAQFAVDGNNSFRVFDITTAGVTLSDLTVQHGSATGAAANGGGIRSTAALTLERVDVVENSAQNNGGGLYATGALTITGGSVRGNTSTSGTGGGLRAQGITTIAGAELVDNTSQGDGGGAFVLQTLSLSGVTFQGNRCTAGSCDGGGLFSFGQTTIDQAQFLGNTAQDQGGGMSAPGDLTVTGSRFEDNEAVLGSGGGVYAQSLATIADSLFLSNTARGSGGGLYAFATVDLPFTRFEDNHSIIGRGGGVYAGGTLTVAGGQFIRNTASEGGGLAHYLGSASLVNSLLVENTAGSGQGMAVLFASIDPAELLHVTIAGHAVPSGAAVELRAGSAEIFSTIITDHAVAIDNTGATGVDQDYNLFSGNGADTQGAVTGGAHNWTGDPLFVDPAAGDYHLGAGSPAVDAAPNTRAVSDFDGDPRPIALGYDTGFDERVQIAGVDFFIMFLPGVFR